jgi:hypothetical protein
MQGTSNTLIASVRSTTSYCIHVLEEIWHTESTVQL